MKSLILQSLIAISSFISTITIANILEAVLNIKLTNIASAVIIITVSTFSFIFSMVKAWYGIKEGLEKKRKLEEDAKEDIKLSKEAGDIHDGQTPWIYTIKRNRRNSTKAIMLGKAMIVQVVDITFDIIVAVALILNQKDYGTKSFILYIGSFIGFGEELFELIIEISYVCCSYCLQNYMKGALIIFFFEIFLCYWEIGFGFWLAAEHPVGTFRTAVMITMAVLLVTALIAMMWGQWMCKYSMELKEQTQKAIEFDDMNKDKYNDRV